MRFDYSIIKNFRNLSAKSPELKIKWEPGINLILGKNGAGKTNLLESLSVLAGWGAFTQTKNLISWNATDSHAGAFAEVSGEENFNITANISSRISLKINGKSASFTDLRIAIPSIIFLTGAVNLTDGTPGARRLFIDRLCALFFPPYAKKLADFKYIMRSRTALLRQGKSPEATTKLFCSCGGWIMDRRREVLELLKAIMKQNKFNMDFLPLIKTSGEEYLFEDLKKNSARELHAGRPLSGPNYEELLITLAENNKPVSEALSRGQKRRLILYLIITAGKLINKRLHRKPVLLLDDLTAELDPEGRKRTYERLNETGWQIFLTAPENPFNFLKKNSLNIYKAGRS